MKIYLPLVFSLLINMSYAQKPEKLVVFYFGATDCGYCNIHENIEKIKAIKSELPNKYKDEEIKFVMVVFDNDLEEGIKFIEKYGYWDEISVGQRYKNELSLAVLNKTEIPGLPHIVVTRDYFGKLPNNIEVIEERKVLKDLVGGKQIGEWVDSGFSLEPE